MKQLYNRYFPTPSYLSMNSCAIDISDQSIKYGELLATPMGIRLGRFVKEKIPKDVVVSGKIENPDELVNILRKIKERENLHYVRVSMPEEQMYLFSICLPKAKEKELKEMITLQIEEHIPLKAEDTVFDFEIVSIADDKIYAEVSAISAVTVESYLSVFKRAGLVPLSLELEAQAISRSVISHDDHDISMIVDFGDSRTGVSIVHDGKVFFTTTLDMGGSNLTTMIAKNFSLTTEKAEEMKRSYGLDGVSNIEDIFPVILNGISVLKDELNKQYVYWKDHDDSGKKHGLINRIILCGGDANLTGLADYLQASMKIKVEHANVWVNISDMKLSVPHMSFEESLSYATVLGLALGDFSYDTCPVVNVLPEPEKKKIFREYWKRITVFSLSLFSLSIFIFILLLMPSYFYSASKLNISESRLDILNSENKSVSIEDLDLSINSINSKLSLLSSASPKYSVYNDIIGKMLTLRPRGVKFSQILFSKTKDNKLKVEINGTSLDRTSLRVFKTNIDNDPVIDSSNLPISDFLEKSNLNFTMSVYFK